MSEILSFRTSLLHHTNKIQQWLRFDTTESWCPISRRYSTNQLIYSVCFDTNRVSLQWKLMALRETISGICIDAKILVHYRITFATSPGTGCTSGKIKHTKNIAQFWTRWPSCHWKILLLGVKKLCYVCAHSMTLNSLADGLFSSTASGKNVAFCAIFKPSKATERLREGTRRKST